MFGYVVPLRPELKVRESDAYQAAYCGLCHATGRRYGFLSRFFLSYDFAFLAMVLTTEGESASTERRRCIACPLRGKDVCTGGDWLDTAAGESVILSYWKLRDSVRDASFWKGLGARLLSLVLRPAYRKAARRHGAFEQAVRGQLEQLQRLEEERCASMDRTADTFASILQSAAPETGDPARDRTLGQLLYHVGRWIYLVDAWDDLAEDRARGGFNPLLCRFPDGPEGHREELRATLRHSLNLSASAYSLAEFGPWGGVLANILYLGLPMVEEAVFTGQWRKLKQKREK